MGKSKFQKEVKESINLAEPILKTYPSGVYYHPETDLLYDVARTYYFDYWKPTFCVSSGYDLFHCSGDQLENFIYIGGL